MKINGYFREWFSFSRSEKNGIVVLLILIFVFSFLNLFRGFFNREDLTDFSEFESKIPKVISTDNTKSSNVSSTDSAILFIFDPNTVSEDEFIKLGFSEKNAATLIKFRNSKGHFDKKEDFKKLFFVNEHIYDKYSPYIVIEKEDSTLNEGYKKNNYESEKKEKINIEINGADSADLESLPGIGPSFASRIIKYREKLGGFYSVSQLNEVYGFTPELFEKVKNSVYVSPDLIRKIDVNKAEFRELIRHPYLNKQKVIKILDFRKVMKQINNIDELVKNKILEPGDSEKLMWYFSF